LAVNIRCEPSVDRWLRLSLHFDVLDNAPVSATVIIRYPKIPRI